MWSQPEIAHDHLPDPPAPEALETLAVLRAAIQARAALAELKGLCQALPQPELLLHTVVLQESQDSSAIEDIVTTKDQLYQAVVNPLDQAPPGVKEVLRYREAVKDGVLAMRQAGGISTNTATLVMQRIKGTTAGLRTLPGTKLSNPATGRIVYTPPGPEQLAGLMARWERFAHEHHHMDPLVRMAAAHYQFEAIHPFADGNGRTGRIINVLLLIHEELLTQPVLYLSSYILQHKPDYYRLLREVTERDAWEPWLLFMLRAVEETAKRTIQLIREVLTLKEGFTGDMRGISNKMPVMELAELLFSFPYVKVNTLVDHGLGTRPTATHYLRALTQRGLLHQRRIGREFYYINHRLTDLLARSGSPDPER